MRIVQILDPFKSTQARFLTKVFGPKIQLASSAAAKNIVSQALQGRENTVLQVPRGMLLCSHSIVLSFDSCF